MSSRIVSAAVPAALRQAASAADQHKQAADRLAVTFFDLYQELTDGGAASELGWLLHLAHGLVTCACARAQDLEGIVAELARRFGEGEAR